MNPLPLPCALIGVGGFGLQHLTVLRTLEESGRLRLAAVSDPRVHLLEARHSLASRGVRMYEDAGEMLDREQDLRIAIIAAPIPYHHRLARMCLERGLFVYLEKPPAPLLDQIDDLIALDRGVRVTVGFQLIDTPWAQRLKQWIVEGAMGEVTAIRIRSCWPRTTAYYQRAGWAGKMSFEGEPVFDGPATNALSHLIHNLNFFAGPDQHSFAEPAVIHGELYRARPVESYDIASLRGAFDSGIGFSAVLAHAGDQPRPFSIEVTGTRGWARFSEETHALEGNLGSQAFDRDAGRALLTSYGRFLDRITGVSHRLSSSLADTRGYVLATNAMLVSSGGITTLEEPWVERRQIPEGEVYVARHLLEAIDHPSAGVHFPELIPWAKSSSGVDVRKLDAARVRGVFGRTEKTVSGREDEASSAEAAPMFLSCAALP